jgi:endonuclease-3
MKKKSITNIIDKMYEMFPANKTELEYSTPFQLLIAVILSAQSTDKQVNKITKLLFQTIITPDDIIRL